MLLSQNIYTLIKKFKAFVKLQAIDIFGSGLRGLEILRDPKYVLISLPAACLILVFICVWIQVVLPVLT